MHPSTGTGFERIKQIVSIVILLVAFLATPIVIMGLISGADPEARQYLTGQAAQKVSLGQWLLHLILWATIVLLSGAFWLHSHAIKAELERALVDSERAETESADSSPPTSTDEPKTALDVAIAYYKALKYERLSGFESNDGSQRIVFARASKGEDGLWRRDGAIIYPDGESAKISVGVLYDSDSWAYNSEFKVQKFRFGAPVKVKTALNRPLLEAIAQRSQHLITIGLASMGAGGGEASEDELQQTNKLLAGARGYNLAYAAWELGWKPAEYIHPITMGRAKKPPSSPTFEPLQRTAIIVGVNGPAVEVTGRDLMLVSLRLMEDSPVDLSNYDRSVNEPGQIGSITPGGGYKSRDDFQLVSEGFSALVLAPAGSE